MRKLIAILGAVAAAAVVGLLALANITGRHPFAQAQAQQKPAAAKEKPPVRQPAAQPGAGASAPVRTETVTYDAWTVTCRDTADGKSKKTCAASLPIVVREQNQRMNVGAWVIAHNNEGALLALLQTPQIDIGVLIPKGVELKLGEGTPHKLNYLVCNPQRCEATMPMDEPLIKEATAAASRPADITFWKADGTAVTIHIQSIGGIERAIAAVR